MKKAVLVVNGNNDYVRLLSFMGYNVYTNLNNNLISAMDLVMFTGGADVHPSFYNGIHKGISFTEIERDFQEREIFNECLKYNIKMTGICRGIQFLNVMCGGQMYQHITNHGGYLHDIIFPATNKIVRVTSTHHQLVMLPDDAVPMAWAYPENRSTCYIGPDTTRLQAPAHEIEAAVYPRYNAFGVQFHPEMGICDKTGVDYYCQILSDFMKMSLGKFINIYGVYNGNKKRGTTSSRN